MQLATTCPSCNAPITATLPDDTNEFDAALLAPRIYCRPCARLRLALGATVVSNPVSTLPAAQAAPESKDGGMGELLRETERAKGALKRGPVVTASDHGEPTLAQLGITKNESSKAGG